MDRAEQERLFQENIRIRELESARSNWWEVECSACDAHTTGAESTVEMWGYEHVMECPALKGDSRPVLAPYERLVNCGVPDEIARQIVAAIDAGDVDAAIDAVFQLIFDVAWRMVTSKPGADR